MKKPLKSDKKVDAEIQEYPSCLLSQDIYNRSIKEGDLDPEDISKHKTLNSDEVFDTMNEKDFEDDLSGSDLDIPGSELDDQQEAIGSEDEENNYYSIGGDNHDDLEENRED